MDHEQDHGHLVSSQPQITLSQYEYRVSRLPVRRYPRRRRRQHETTSPEHADVVTLAPIPSSPNAATTSRDDNQIAHDNTMTDEQPENEPIEHNDHSPIQHTAPAQMQDECHSLPSADNIDEYDSNSKPDNTFTAPTAHMYLDDDDDHALLRDADTCDSDVPTTNTDDEEDKHDIDYVSPMSTQDDSSARSREKRKVLKDVDTNSIGSPVRGKSSRTKKKSRHSSAFEAVLSSNQLIMVRNGSVESGSFHEDPCSSPDEDEIEDSQMHIRHDLRKPPRTTRTPAKTVTAKALHQRMRTINSALADADRFTTPTPSRRGGRSRPKRSILDVGDGFDVAERTVTKSSLLIKKSVTKRLSTPSVPTTRLELETTSATSAPRSRAHGDDDGTQIHVVEEVDEVEECDSPEEAENSPMSLQDPISRIANMAHVMRNTNLSGESRGKRQNVSPLSRKQRAGKSRPHPARSLELAFSNDLPMTMHPRVRNVKQGVQGSVKFIPQPKTPGQKHRQFISGDGFDGHEHNSAPFTTRQPAPLDEPQAMTASSANALSHPGNFAAVTQLAEEAEDPIEDNGPSILPRQSVPVGTLQFEFPQHYAVATTPKTVQAAYPTPPTTVGTFAKRPAWDETPSRLIIPAQVSRTKHADLAEQIIGEGQKEMNDTTFGRPPSAAYSSPSRDRVSGDTQLDQSSMMLDDAELSWDSSTRPGSFNTALPLNTRRPPKPLKELTGQVSRNFGTISPEKNAARRTASHLLTSKAPFRRQDNGSRLARAG